MNDENARDETENHAPEVRETPDSGPESTAEERIAELEAELADARDKLLRALAEGENQRRRFVREREASLRYAAANFANELLSVADNLRRAIASEAAISSDPAAKGGIEGVAPTQPKLGG